MVSPRQPRDVYETPDQGAVAAAAAAVALTVTAPVWVPVAAGAIALAAGLGAAYIDWDPCVNECKAVACVGLVLGAFGAIAGSPALAADAGFITEMPWFDTSAIAGLFASGAGTLLDTFNFALEAEIAC